MGFIIVGHVRMADSLRDGCEPDDLFTPRSTRQKWPRAGLFFGNMNLQVNLQEPAIKRAVAFIDAQNLYHAAKEAFGYTFPNYDVLALSTKICQEQNWNLSKVQFYTGVPDATDDPFWNSFWNAKLAQMGRQRIELFSRPLRYRNQTIRLATGQASTVLVGQEKGIDVRIALDIVRLAYQRAFDVALVFSQDQDLSEVADEIRLISKHQMRWILIACAFPSSPTRTNKRGINGTNWIKIERPLYDSCIDARDYRPKPAGKP
jgi:uncharacterized LabA/DUF88 family protein